MEDYYKDEFFRLIKSPSTEFEIVEMLDKIMVGLPVNQRNDFHQKVKKDFKDFNEQMTERSRLLCERLSYLSIFFLGFWDIVINHPIKEQPFFDFNIQMIDKYAGLEINSNEHKIEYFQYCRRQLSKPEYSTVDKNYVERELVLLIERNTQVGYYPTTILTPQPKPQDFYSIMLKHGLDMTRREFEIIINTGGNLRFDRYYDEVDNKYHAVRDYQMTHYLITLLNYEMLPQHISMYSCNGKDWITLDDNYTNKILKRKDARQYTAIMLSFDKDIKELVQNN